MRVRRVSGPTVRRARVPFGHWRAGSAGLNILIRKVAGATLSTEQEQVGGHWRNRRRCIRPRVNLLHESEQVSHAPAPENGVGLIGDEAPDGPAVDAGRDD